jgi:hypothetical protein
MSQTEHPLVTLTSMVPVAFIEPVAGWALMEAPNYDGDGFSYLDYYAVRGNETRLLDVSRFRFSPSQARFAWLIENGFPPRPTLGPWDDTDIEMRMAVPWIAA